jgi:site-specific recombinase XerC
LLREVTGWCGPCSRPRPPKQPPRICAECGQLRKHAGLGLCGRCWQRHPDRPFVRVDNLIAELDHPPTWLGAFAVFVADRHCVARACAIISGLGRLLRADIAAHPQTLLERARRPGRSMGTLAMTLEEFFVDHQLALPTDQAERLAAGRRQRRIAAVPETLRPAAKAFEVSMLHARERARRAGTRPRSDHTIEQHLATVRDLAKFLAQHRGITDWAAVDVTAIEAFLATKPAFRKSGLGGLRQFFGFARRQRLVLIDPTQGLVAKEPRGFQGTTLTPSEQRRLFQRWTTDTGVHPHEAFVGLLALLHGASPDELRGLSVTDINTAERTVHLGRRAHPVPLDPASWTALQHCLDHRRELRTANPHVIVTRVTRTGRRAASAYFFSHVLDPAGVRPKQLRSTRLVDLVNTLDPKLVAAAFGMTPEGVLFYFADRIDPVLEANL